MKTEIDETQDITKWKLHGDWDETTNFISQCNNHPKKNYNTRHDRVGKVNHYELSKKLKIWPNDKMLYA